MRKFGQISTELLLLIYVKNCFFVLYLGQFLADSLQTLYMS